VLALTVLVVFVDDVEVVQRVVNEGNKAATWQERADVLSRQRLTDSQLALVVGASVSDDSSKNLQVIGAMAVSGITNRTTYDRCLNMVIEKAKSNQVRLIALVDGILEGKIGYSSKTLERDRSEIMIRASLAIAASDIGLLEQYLGDPSPFVRAVVARRIGKLFSVKDKTTDERVFACVDVLLVDPNGLVRGNAIVAARGVRYCPVAVARGLLFDSRPYVSVMELFSDEQESMRLREANGLVARADWIITLFAKHQVALLSSDPVLKRMLLPLQQRVLIGGLSGHWLLEIEPERAKEIIPWSLRAGLPRAVRAQLEMLK
jgi:hypothetical protein